MKVEKTRIDDVWIFKPSVFEDERGLFIETFKRSEFKEVGIEEDFVQDSYSRTCKNVLRGLHYQNNPKAMGKLITCIHGKVFDVAVDIRKGSPTFGKWVGVELSEKNRHIVYIPPGFAHGFVALSERADLLYKMTEEYSKEHDRGILWNDPDINIQWPVKEPLLSEKDKNNPPLKAADNNLTSDEN